MDKSTVGVTDKKDNLVIKILMSSKARKLFNMLIQSNQFMLDIRIQLSSQAKEIFVHLDAILILDSCMMVLAIKLQLHSKK